MDTNIDVLDISSDEDTEDFEWITELYGVEVGEIDNDDVVVISEVTSGKQKLKSSNVDDGDDEDCVILDDDPDMPMSIVEDDAGDRPDELIVVGEKGMIACRDYPHSRHLCAKFRFSATAHETYCDLCHCYVCDSLAPCQYWKTGNSVTGHCHANDKEETWKLQRRNVKLGKSGSKPAPKFPHPPRLMNQVPSPTHNFPHTPPNMNQVPPPNHYNSLPRHKVARPTVLFPCSSSTNYHIPNIKNQRSAPHFHKNRLPFRTFLPKSVGVLNNQRERFQNVGNRGRTFVSSPSMFKRSKSIRAPFLVIPS